MAQFYGHVQGNRGDATRMGSKDSGFSASAQAWGGSLILRMSHYDKQDVASISFGEGSTTGGRELFRMPVAEIAKKVRAGYEFRLVKPRK